MRFLVALLVFLSPALALATTANSITYGSQHVDYFRNGTPGMIMCKGTSDNNAYMATCDPTTGALQVDASIVFPPGTEVGVTNLPDTVDTNYGTVGTSTIRSASQIGNATGAAAFGAGTTTTQTLRVVLPSDQVVPTSQYGKTYSDSVRNVYSSTNVTTGAWVELIAATAAAINCITLFDSSGVTLELGTGAAASEARVLIIPPGGISGCVPLRIAASTRVSIRAISATANMGELDISGLN